MRIDVDLLWCGGRRLGRRASGDDSGAPSRGKRARGVSATASGTCGAPRARVPAGAADQVVVHETHRLHERVDGRRPDEAEAARLQVARQRRRGVGRRRDRARESAARAARGRRREAPDVAPRTIRARAARRAPRARCGSPPRSCRDGGRCPASASRRATSRAPKRATRCGIEVAEGAAEVLALAQDRQPREPRLKALEHELLEEPRVVGDRASPFVVVVGDVERIGRRPPAARARRRSSQRGLARHGADVVPTRVAAKDRGPGLKPTPRLV